MATERKQNVRVYQCVMCAELFKAARDHAECCSPRCRKRLSRVRSAERARILGADDAHVEQLVKCADCGMRRDRAFVHCPICKCSRTV